MCASAALAEGDGIAVNEGARTLLLVRKGGQVHAWVDRCPHLQISMRVGEQPFMLKDGSHVQCRQHFAVFRSDDGVCVRGPCEGRKLTRVAVREEGGQVWRCEANTQIGR
ncbi:MAG: Rieske 2Fe-2S domain-containing protein [Burkholderiaceae bacterium]|nr:Rieske 2Fe-2S domain-containing protein [Burkholderiaceae bacterium]